MKPENSMNFLDAVCALMDDLVKSGAFNPKEDKPADAPVECSVTKEEELDTDIEIPFADSDVCPFGDLPCDQCVFEKACMEDLGYGDSDDSDGFDCAWGIPGIDRILFSDPATIVFWMDGTKTVVKCMAGEKFERYAGFAAACMKKMFGSTSFAKTVMREFGDDQPPKEKKSKKIAVPDLTSAFVEVANKEAPHEAPAK